MTNWPLVLYGVLDSVVDGYDQLALESKLVLLHNIQRKGAQ